MKNLTTSIIELCSTGSVYTDGIPDIPPLITQSVMQNSDTKSDYPINDVDWRWGEG